MKHKFIQYHGVWDIDELYDLESDPQQLVNLAEDPAYGEALERLRKRCEELGR